MDANKLIQETFPEAEALGGIEAFEVADSYCPGDYDLSIQNRKIAGIAQRRLKDVVCVSIYLSVYGDQNRRGLVVRDSMTTQSKGKKRNGISQKSTPIACGILVTLLESTSRLKTFKSAYCRL